MEQQRSGLLARLVGAIRTDASSRPATELLQTVDAIRATRVIDLTA